MQLLQDVKTKDVAKYALLPGIIPRINSFIDTGFSWLATLMAYIYSSVRLLPDDHPYLNSENFGKFGMRHVIMEAANNIVVKKENIDQIVIFFILLMALILVIMQFLVIIFNFVINPAFAFAPYMGIFTTASCTALAPPGCNDIAHMLLDRVFAVPDLYNSVFAQPAGLGNVPLFNSGLQQLFQFYSNAMLILAIVVVLYYVVALVGETAISGTPFGRRFNHVYAPLRLVFAIGILVPVHYGYNSGQMIALFAAKWGSGFATNTWMTYNVTLAGPDSPVGTRFESLVARPVLPDITHVMQFMSLVATCAYAYDVNAGITVGAWVIPDVPPLPLGPGWYPGDLDAYNHQDVLIRFGAEVLAPGEDTYRGNIKPYCGEVVIQTTVAGDGPVEPAADQRIGAYVIQEAYYDMIAEMWDDAINPAGDLRDFAERMHGIAQGQGCAQAATPVLTGDCDSPPSADFKQLVMTGHNAAFQARVQNAYDRMIALGANPYDIPAPLLNRGWAGAAIWYNRIAEWNGTMAAALINTPSPSREPEVMREVNQARRAHNEGGDSESRYDCELQGGRPIDNLRNYEKNICKSLAEVHRYWIQDGKAVNTDLQTSGNVFHDLLNTVFGIGGLFTIRNNDDIHPLAQLSALGKSIIESSIRNLMTSLIYSVGGGAGEIIGTHLGAYMSSVSTIYVSFTSIGLAVGFMLYYVLPFLPFMYFFFAVGGWIKTIFESMVGIPLWALAHLRLDGNGFPGDTASNGYFLIFEIFIRPVLTVFGLIASMAIFTAMARTLNGIFDLVVENLAGFDCIGCDAVAVAGMEFKRSAIDEFFFTVIYTVIIYMLATSSFKMIDQVPNSILRWMGAGVQSFSDQRGDPAQNLTQYAAFGGANMASQVTGALQTGGKAAGNAIGAPFGIMSRNAGGTGMTGAGNLGKGSAGMS